MNIALVGNPNTGKSSLFNRLTGLNQKVGNFPGVTVDKKIGQFRLADKQVVRLIDLPGTYSIYPTSKDEEVVIKTLLNPKSGDFPDAVIVIADATNLKRNLLLFSQVANLGIPIALALTMSDEAEKKNLEVDADQLSDKLGVPVFPINARSGEGVEELRKALPALSSNTERSTFDPRVNFESFTDDLKEALREEASYKAWIQGISGVSAAGLMDEDDFKSLAKKHGVHRKRAQVKETIQRYATIDEVLSECVHQKESDRASITEKLDAILTHKIYGFVVFFLLLGLVFQAIFSWSEWPMDMIESFFNVLSNWSRGALPEGPLADLISDGVIPGLAGVLVFIPQIAILFGFISILEESGYMSRVVFIMDKLMRQFGLSGKSVVPLISGMACAIPAIMATRTIGSWKERLITILVTPFTTCSARLPVYTILISLVIPSTDVFGFLNLQGLVLMALYVFGFAMAIIAAVVFHWILKAKHKGYLMLEMPPYRIPQFRNVGLTMYEKVSSFVFSAGKIILAISIVLWALASYGPNDLREAEHERIEAEAVAQNWEPSHLEQELASVDLKTSYIGIFGKSIEPVIAPLGYDWKIGIALITSFAAREVFVGTIATIYAVGDAENERSIVEQMRADTNDETGQPLFNLATGLSLLLFYALAMQCMSTLAIVKRETKGWKWPLIQFGFMTSLAYVLSLIVYQIAA